MNTRQSIRPLIKLLMPLLSVAVLAPAAGAATYPKADNEVTLNRPDSWAGGTAPGDGDIALWDSTVTEVIGPALGDDLSWLGLQITKPGGAVYLGTDNDPNTLTLGASGIDASASKVPVYLRAPVTLAAHQTWSAGSSGISIGVPLSVSTVTNGGFTLTIGAGSVSLLDNLTGTGGLTNSGAGTVVIIGECTYTGDTTANGKIQLGNAGNTGSISGASVVTSTNGGIFQFSRSDDFTFANTITGDVNIAKYGAGQTVTLTGNNTYTGSTRIYFGTLSVSSINSVKDNASLGTVHSESSKLGAPATNVDGFISFGTVSDTGQLTYTGTGETTDRGIHCGGTTGGAVVDQSGTGLLKFTHAVVAAGEGSKVLTLQGSTAGTGEIAGAIADNSDVNKTGVTKAGSGTWTLSGVNTYTGATTIHAGVLLVNGSIGATTTSVNGGTLGGSGSVGDVAFTELGGTLSPGASAGTTGILSAGAINLTSAGKVTVALELNGLTEGDGYDQIKASGPVNLGTNAMLKLTLGFKPAAGKAFTVIKSSGNTPPTGTFKGQAEGSAFNVSGTNFKISYRGGKGGDVVLTAAP